MTLALCLLAAYLLGAVPFGFILAKAVCGIDVRNLGSGNTGATNVVRTVGWKLGIPVLVLDAAKGFLPTLFLPHFLGAGSYWGILAGLAAILGHTFSPFLGFSGGRGVATALGVMLAIAWEPALLAFLLAAALIILFRYVSLGSIAGSLSLPFLMLLFKEPPAYVIFTSLLALLVIFRHIPNIRRLLSGSELKLGAKSSSPPGLHDCREDPSGGSNG
jgi:acyl phosphate:glycerol-3-phosphate acyltransferase